MNDNGKSNDNLEDLQTENDFLKMKMMLEKGAQFGGNHPDLTPEIENAFLQSVIAFEEQFEDGKTIKLYDKIGQPTIFRPVAEIAEEDIPDALDSVLNWLEEYNINVNVLSPNVSVTELYRFIIEELFEYEIDDMDMPGWVSEFTYDDFYPDPMYETSTIAEIDCLPSIFSKNPVSCMHLFVPENIQLNKLILNEQNFQKHINHFKAAYDNIECMDLFDIHSKVSGNGAHVTGKYALRLTYSGKEEILHGSWSVGLETRGTIPGTSIMFKLKEYIFS